MDYRKLIERIYEENDTTRNISLVIAGSIGLILYLLKIELTAIILSSIITYALVKEIIKYIIGLREKKRLKSLNNQEIDQKFSDSEKETIQKFIEIGSCFISYDDYRKGNIDNHNGLDSLVRRGIIEFRDELDMAPGFILDESIFLKFLNHSKK